MAYAIVVVAAIALVCGCIIGYRLGYAQAQLECADKLEELRRRLK
jgi:membrane protein YqaA with SNARE-associated domain